MSDTPLKNQIISWLNDRDYWFKYAGNKLLEGEAVTDTLIAETYLLFKEDNGLKKTEDGKTEIVFNKIANDEVPTKTIRLKSINNIDNVNALAKKQSIEINPNLTIIYGENGTGKSGYVRLLNNAFSSRGDKKIIPNVFESKDTKDPCCNFIFQSDDSDYELEFPEKKDNIEFVQYSVFDSQSVKVHLEENNKLNFTPSGFEFFEKAIKLYEGVSQKLQEEIADKRLANEYLKHFNNDNDIQSEITGLGVETDFEKLNVIGNYSESDEESLTEFISESEKLKILDIPKKMMELQKLQDLLTKFTAQQKEASDFLKQENIESYKSLISLLQKNRNLAAQEGIDSLNEYQIESLSSNEWREFIKASRSYASAIEKSRGNEYPSDSDNCLFCLQPLTDKENVLIKSYWKLLKSEAEEELKRTTYKIEGIEKKLKELSTVKFNETTTLFQYVNKTTPDLAKKWKDIVSSIEITQKNLITNLSNQNWELPISPCVASISEFDLVAMKITGSIEALRKKNPVKEIEELEIKINYLKDKCLLNKLLEQITQFVSSHKWAEKAERAGNLLNTRSVTSQQGKLFSQHVTESYTNHFNSECEKLNAPRVVDIVQKNSKATSLRKLQVAGNVASSILSEGEQRAISLADFLTETHLNPRNNGLFFDDPVTSQDHHRREKIATRLVEISAHKQIVVFTHDIAFFTRLKFTAEKLDINHHYTTIRKSGGSPGIISPELPWIVQPVNKRVKTLRDRLVKLKKTEQKASEDEYLFAAKAWYGLLREAWERVVEERLFKGVVEGCD